jgi:hypothetical protein
MSGEEKAVYHNRRRRMEYAIAALQAMGVPQYAGSNIYPGLAELCFDMAEVMMDEEDTRIKEESF